MRTVIIGLGNQGQKRGNSIPKEDIIALVDINQPHNSNVHLDYRDIKDVPLDTYDAALICTPHGDKLKIVEYLIENCKHVLVEKPLIGDNNRLHRLKWLSKNNSVTLYTAYNHTFEPNIIKLRQYLEHGEIGKIHYCKMFYGNGTAKDVGNSDWQDNNTGVLENIGVHLLDLVLFLFGKPAVRAEILSLIPMENRAPDYSLVRFNCDPIIYLESTYMSWRNTFTIDIIGEKGSIHLDGLQKWGGSSIFVRRRVYPSGVPTEIGHIELGPDLTWANEYKAFKEGCKVGMTNIDNDIWINNIIQGAMK